MHGAPTPSARECTLHAIERVTMRGLAAANGCRGWVATDGRTAVRRPCVCLMRLHDLAAPMDSAARQPQRNFRGSERASHVDSNPRASSEVVGSVDRERQHGYFLPPSCAINPGPRRRPRLRAEAGALSTEWVIADNSCDFASDRGSVSNRGSAAARS